MHIYKMRVRAARTLHFACETVLRPVLVPDSNKLAKSLPDPAETPEAFALAQQFHTIMLQSEKSIRKTIMLKEGDKAPDFTAKDQDGKDIKLSDLKGQRVVLYFYPKDDTPGCTKEACSFRDADDIYRSKGIKVLGVSTDDEKSHQKFISKYQLPFDLLADTDKKIVNEYGVWGEKSMYGKKYMGTNRKTFLIDEDGNIAKIFDKVDVTAHADEVLEAFGEK
jgi:thioredoxin-dependent peroxiredoxin